MRDYLLGLITLPVLAGVGFALFIAWIWATETLRDRWGIFIEAKVRDTSKISDYVLRNNIWWERSFGLLFVGGWYRESYQRGAEHRLVNRWIGLGMNNGPCFMVFREYDLGRVAELSQSLGPGAGGR